MKLITGLFLLFVASLIYMANTGQENILFELKRQIAYGDKVGHFLLYGTSTLLLNLALNGKSLPLSPALQVGSLAVLVATTLEEFSQLFIARRTFSVLDMCANVSGIFCFTLFSLLILKMLSRRQDGLSEKHVTDELELN